MISESIKTALDKSAAELCLRDIALFHENDLSVFLSHYIDGFPEQQRLDCFPSGKNKMIESLKDNLNDQLLAHGLSIKDLLDDERYMERVFKLVCDRRQAGKDAPSLRISPHPIDGACYFEGVNLALIFGANPMYFQDTAHCWHIDEAKSFTDYAASINAVNVLGVHYEWLTKDLKASRALIVDERALVKEVSFTDPIGLDVVHITELPLRNERRLHHELSRAFSEIGVKQINPYMPSTWADDKYLTYKKLKSHGIDTPRAFLIPRKSSHADSRKSLDRILKIIKIRRRDNNTTLYVQPNHGTEGRMVQAFNLDEPDLIERLLQHISETVHEDEALIRIKKGDIRYYKDHDRGYRNIVFRIHVAWNGTDFIAESGFAQVASNESNPVASRGRDGCVLNIHEALNDLYYRDEESKSWEKVDIDAKDIDKIKNAAVRSARAINEQLVNDEKLKLLGVDVVLEYQKRSVTPYILEINPRLAGLNHSASIDDDRYYISREIFDYLRNVKSSFRRKGLT